MSELRPAMARAGITRVANITGLDDIGIPVVLVTRPNSRSLSVSQGKGASLLAAKLSGIMESLEQFHAEHVLKPVLLASYSELAQNGSVVQVERLPRSTFSNKPFDEHQRILWVQAEDVRTGCLKYVPYEMVHLDLRLPLPEGHGFFAVGSNGLASGRTALDALNHAIWELIERDALARFYEFSPKDQAERRVQLASVDDGECCSLLDRFRDASVGVAIWEISSDVGVASFMCSVVENDFNPLRRIGMARGFGCHPQRGVALRRALTEAAQSRLTRISGSRDDISVDDVDVIRTEASIREQQQHLAQEDRVFRRFEDAATTGVGSAAELLEHTLLQLSRAGLSQVLRVDLSRADMPIAVVRAIIPGLEGAPDDPFYVPGERARAIREKGQPS